jgi:uncharacterized RDD family membrane protein YckC
MKKIKITTPENIDIEYTLADLGSRSGASLIDMVFQGILMIILIVSLLLIIYFAPYFWEKYYGWLVGTAILIFGLISYGYYIVMELSMNGQTPGKKILKIRTIRINGEPVTIQHSALRNLFKVFIDVFGIGVVMIFFTKEHRRLGDYAASTIVIIEGNKERPVTLESLQKVKVAVNYYITREEEEVLKSYMERKGRMKDCTKLQKEIKAYFTDKFEAAGVLSDFEEFIRQI